MRKLGMTVLILAAIVSAGTAIGGCGKSTGKNAEEQRQSIEESAMQAYLETASTGGAEDKVPDPNVPEVAVISVFVPSDTGIQKQMDALDVLGAEALFAKMKEYGALSEGAKLLSFTKEGEGAKLSCTGVDLNDEVLAVALGNTFIENFELISLTIESDGMSTEKTTNMKYNTDYKNLKK